tara:strand:- start:6540 stop:6872 length:333 start_codon:yes stop_codon:yes gene_type:complete
MSELKINGIIKEIGEIKTFDSGFTKVEFVVTTKEQYPQDIKFEITQAKVEDFIKYNKVGKEVDVSFNIRGNEYNGKYYVNLQAWKVFGATSDQKKQEDTPLEKGEGHLPF